MGNEVASDDNLENAVARIEAQKLVRSKRRDSVSLQCKAEFRLWDELTDKKAAALRLALANKHSFEVCLDSHGPDKCKHHQDDFNTWFDKYVEYEEQSKRAYQAWLRCEGIPPEELE